MLITLYIVVNNYLKINVLYWVLSVGFVCVCLGSVCGYSQREGKRATAITGGRSAKGQEEGTKGQQQDPPATTTSPTKSQTNRPKPKAKTFGRKKQNQQPPHQKKSVFLTQSQCV